MKLVTEIPSVRYADINGRDWPTAKDAAASSTSKMLDKIADDDHNITVYSSEGVRFESEDLVRNAEKIIEVLKAYVEEVKKY